MDRSITAALHCCREGDKSLKVTQQKLQKSYACLSYPFVVALKKDLTIQIIFLQKIFITCMIVHPCIESIAFMNIWKQAIDIKKKHFKKSQ